MRQRRSRARRLGTPVAVLALTAATGIAALLMPDTAERHDGQFELGSRTAVALPPLSVDWVRTPTVRDLMARATTVVRASVVRVESAPPIRAADARAPEGTPDLPRQLVRFSSVERLAGSDPGAQFDVVRVLPPSGVAAPEDVPYRVGERYLLFLQPLDAPGTWQPAAYQLVSIDGRFAVKPDGRLRGLLDHGPEAELNASADLKQLLRRFAR